MAKATQSTVTTRVTLPATLLRQVEARAVELQLSTDQLFARALELFVLTPHHAPAAPVPTHAPRVINQGDIYWVKLDDGQAGAAIAHPYVVVQDNLFNHSRIDTVVVCALTSNLRRTGETPGNVLLDAGEANLPKQSVVEVSKVTTVQKAQLGAQIGTLAPARVDEILAGMRFLQRAAFGR